jgi:hypothetical protein
MTLEGLSKKIDRLEKILIRIEGKLIALAPQRKKERPKTPPPSSYSITGVPPEIIELFEASIRQLRQLKRLPIVEDDLPRPRTIAQIRFLKASGLHITEDDERRLKESKRKA